MSDVKLWSNPSADPIADIEYGMRLMRAQANREDARERARRKIWNERDALSGRLDRLVGVRIFRPGGGWVRVVQIRWLAWRRRGQPVGPSIPTVIYDTRSSSQYGGTMCLPLRNFATTFLDESDR